MCWTTARRWSRNAAGELVVIGSSDSRREIQYMLKKGWDLKQLLGSAIPDPYNNDLYASVLNLPPSPAPVPSREIGPPPAPAIVTDSRGGAGCHGQSARISRQRPGRHAARLRAASSTATAKSPWMADWTAA